MFCGVGWTWTKTDDWCKLSQENEKSLCARCTQWTNCQNAKHLKYACTYKVKENKRGEISRSKQNLSFGRFYFALANTKSEIEICRESGKKHYIFYDSEL